MRPQLRALASRNGGVFTRRAALTSGYTAQEVRVLTRPDGEWVIVCRGSYVERELWETHQPDARYALRARAVHQGLPENAVLSHASSAAFLEMPQRASWCEHVHVTRPRAQRGGGLGGHGVKHHSARLDDMDLATFHDLRLTGRARTAVDIGREFGFEDAVIACDAALRLGTTRRQLHETLSRMTCWRSTPPVRSAVAIADGGAESVGESLTRLLVLELGIGIPETQFHISGPGWVAIADLRVGHHLVEFDGRVKYVGREHGGFATRPASDVLWAEKRREDRLRSLGWGVSRVVWSELFGQARRRTSERLLHEFEQTVRRHGTAA